MSDKLSPSITIVSLSPAMIAFAVGLTLDLQLASTRNFHLIISSLQRSQCLSTIRTTWGNYGTTSKLLVIFQLCGAMAFCEQSIKKGLLDATDVLEFPKHMRRKMVLSAWLGWLSFSWLMVSAIIF